LQDTEILHEVRIDLKEESHVETFFFFIPTVVCALNI
jgi:hypothetical protein